MFARTERLLLRPGWSEDAPALFQAICDERVVRNLAQAPWPYTPDHAEAFLARERDPRDMSLLIFLRTSDAPRLAGGIGVHRLESGEHELGYWIARSYWSQGIATEAGRAVIANARDTLRLRRLVSGHFLDNPASGRVLAKLGFRPVRTERRYSAGRSAEVPCKLFELELSGEPCTASEACAMAA